LILAWNIACIPRATVQLHSRHPKPSCLGKPDGERLHGASKPFSPEGAPWRLIECPDSSSTHTCCCQPEPTAPQDRGAQQARRFAPDARPRAPTTIQYAFIVQTSAIHSGGSACAAF